MWTEQSNPVNAPITGTTPAKVATPLLIHPFGL
jgi:hypothetical protein